MWWLSVSNNTIKYKQISCSNTIISNSYETVNFQRQVQYSNNRRFPVGLPDLASCDCTPHCVPSRLFNRRLVYWQPAAVRLFRNTFDDGRFQSTVWIFFRFTIIRHFQSAISGWTPRLGFLRLDTPLRSVVCWPVGWYTDVWQPPAVRPFRSTFDDGRFQSTVRIFCAVTIIRYFPSTNFNFDSIICWD